MISVIESKPDELEIFTYMERQSHVGNFINITDLETHRRNFQDPRIIYLSIVNRDNEVAGYFILAPEPESDSVEFRRIVVDQNNRGSGQIAIGMMETYCKRELNVKRIWLDVYEDNKIGIHIYKKLGYKKFCEQAGVNRNLLFYQKYL